MPSIERCASPELMPHLEPASPPNTDVFHDKFVAPPSLPSPTTQTQGHDRDACQLIKDVIAMPLKLRLVLENKGNVARDHLASERTFLAYVRTSLACAGAGVALLQLLLTNSNNNKIDLHKFAQPICASIILMGIIILVFGVVRYFTTQSSLVRGYYPVARYAITIITIILGSLIVTVFGILFAGTRS